MVGDGPESGKEREQIRDGPGMLTQSQREYLHDESDIEEGSQRERTTRSRIRERIINGIDDLDLALFALDNRDLDQIKSSVPESDRHEFLETAAGRLLALAALSAEEARQHSVEPESRIDSDTIADFVTDVVSPRTETFFIELLQSRYFDHDMFIVRDGELEAKIAFDYTSSENHLIRSTEVRKLVRQYEQGKLTKTELASEISNQEDE